MVRVSTMSRRLLPAVFGLALALGGRAAAHDFWIEPATFTPAPDSFVGVGLRVGEHFLGDPVPRDPALLRRFGAVGKGGEQPLRGADGRDPAGLLRTAAAPETLVLVYESAPSAAELTLAKFAQYVAEEGLEHLQVPAPAPPPRSSGAEGAVADPTVRDLFSRHAKAIVGPPGGEPGAAGRITAAAGLELELVPAADPRTLGAGGLLPLTLVFRGQPVAGTRVTAIPRARPRDAVAARTDAAGRVALPLGAGEWLVKAVHAIPADTGSGADYRSYWASLTFRVPGATP
jgi:hypothetical protein